MKKLVIVGNGGFAKEVRWLVDRINETNRTWEFIGFIDNDLNLPEVIGNDDFLKNYNEDIYVSIAIGNSLIREKLYRLYKNNPHIFFANLIDPSVIYSEMIKMGEGNIVCAGTIITVDVSIGNCNIINLNCTIGHGAFIHDFVTINPNVNLSGNTIVDSGCNIGTGVQIIQGINIGSYTVLGAGAVVNKNIPANCTAVGIPARIIKQNG